MEADSEGHWIYLSYGAQVFGDYRIDRIRMKRRRVDEGDLANYRRLCQEAYP